MTNNCQKSSTFSVSPPNLSIQTRGLDENKGTPNTGCGSPKFDSSKNARNILQIQVYGFKGQKKICRFMNLRFVDLHLNFQQSIHQNIF